MANTVLITGAGGFIGHHIVREFAKHQSVKNNSKLGKEVCSSLAGFKCTGNC